MAVIHARQQICHGQWNLVCPSKWRRATSLRTRLRAKHGNKEDNLTGERVRKAVAKLKASGLDDKVARKVLRSWSEHNITDESGLRKQLLSRGISIVTFAAVQVLADSLAAYCCSVTENVFKDSESFGAPALVLIFQILFYYFAAGAGLNLFRLGAAIGGAATLGAKSSTLYAAIEQLAGENTGIDILDKAQAAVSSTKVVLALNSVRRVFKEELHDVELSRTTLSKLSAYFILQHAETNYGWSVNDVKGLTVEEATSAAALFARYDENDDYKLEFTEFKKLVSDADFGLSDDEILSAIRMLDKRGDGCVEFDEFVSWWAGVSDT